MQTFLPYPDSGESAACLDRLRLGKQRVEWTQILRTLAGETDGWANHPAVRMWRGHELALYDYGVAVCDEWTSRGYKDACADTMRELMDAIVVAQQWDPNPAPPPWLGDPALHASHRAALLRKGLEDLTFARHKGQDDLPARKTLWTPAHYATAWERYGQPAIEETHYGQFGWTEAPAVPDARGSLPYVWPVA